METLGAQFYAFGIVLLAGVSLGFLFDLFRVIRGLLRPGLISTPLLDLLFWALFTPLLVLYLLVANWGELRGYVVLGLILGFLFYRLLFSQIIISALLSVVRLASMALNGLIGFALWLLSIPLSLAQEIKYLWKQQRPRGAGRRFRLRWPRGK